tara:strand:+ start:1295 stop:1693 length:399 start_codon:yes stop_codon:yes gene_type:complete
MNLRRYILAGLNDEIEGLEGGVVPTKDNLWIFEALHLKHSLGAVVFFVINLKTQEVLDAKSFIQQKPCYNGERKFEKEVANDHYWVEPVFICSTDENEVNSVILSLNGSKKIYEKYQSSLVGEILVDNELAA